MPSERQRPGSGAAPDPAAAAGLQRHLGREEPGDRQQRRRRIGPADGPACDDLGRWHEREQYGEAQAAVEGPTEGAQAAKHAQRDRTQQQRGQQPHPAQILDAARLPVGRLQQPAVDRPGGRRTKFQDDSRLLVGFAQVRIIIPQSIVVKRGGPVSGEGNQEYKGGDEPAPHTQRAPLQAHRAGVIQGKHDAGVGECFSKYPLRNAHPGILLGELRKIRAEVRFCRLNLCHAPTQTFLPPCLARYRAASARSKAAPAASLLRNSVNPQETVTRTGVPRKWKRNASTDWRS